MGDAQPYVDAFRSGDYFKLLELAGFVSNKYGAIKNSDPSKAAEAIGADELIPLMIYELGLSDIDANDVDNIKFLYNYINAYDPLAAGKYGYEIISILGPLAFALAIKTHESFNEIINKVEIQDRQQFKEFTAQDSPFSTLIDSRSSEARNLMTDLSKTMDKQFLLETIYTMNADSFYNFKLKIDQIALDLKNGNLAFVCPLVAQRVIDESESDQPYNEESYRTYIDLAIGAIEDGEIEFFKKISKVQYIKTVTLTEPELPLDTPIDEFNIPLLPLENTQEIRVSYLSNLNDQKILLQTAVENKQIEIIDLLLSSNKQLHFTPQQFVDYAYLKGFGDNNVEAMIPIFLKLEELEGKVTNLKDRKFEQEAKHVRQLTNRLHKEIKNFLDKGTDNIPDNARHLAEACEKHIEEKKPHLKEHRGWAEFFNTILAVVTLGVSALIRRGVTGSWSPKTDTEFKLYSINTNFKVMKDRLQSSDENELVNDENLAVDPGPSPLIEDNENLPKP